MVSACVMIYGKKKKKVKPKPDEDTSQASDDAATLSFLKQHDDTGRASYTAAPLSLLITMYSYDNHVSPYQSLGMKRYHAPVDLVLLLSNVNILYNNLYMPI